MQSDDTAHTVQYFNQLIDFFYTKGYLGGAIVSYAIAMNPEGYQSSFVFDTPVAYDMYKDALDDFQYVNPVLADTERLNTDAVFEQWVGLKDDLTVISDAKEELYYGIPNLSVWGGPGYFGIIETPVEQYRPPLKLYWAVVPAFDCFAAYFNYDTFYNDSSSSSKWKMLYVLEGVLGTFGALAFFSSFAMGNGPLLLFNKIHIFGELTAAYFAYSA